jgi:hypothetical protein
MPWAQLAGRARTGLTAAGHGLLFLALAVPGLVLSLLVLAPAPASSRMPSASTTQAGRPR